MTHSIDISHLTNDPDLWTKLELAGKSIGLWNYDIQTAPITKHSLDWQKVKYLFIIGTGGFTRVHAPLPCQTWYFDATIDISATDLITHLTALEYTKGHFINHGVKDHLLDAQHKNAHTLFDVLLGLERPHRNFAYDWIMTRSPHKDRYFVSYYRYPGNWQSWIPGFWDGEKQPFEYSGTRVCVSGIGPWNLALISPVKIYNQTVYSLVAETSAVGPTVPTEKTWKPMLSRRLFVMLANRHFLRDIRSLGFKTFDGIIDESYDTVEDDHIRWQMAMEQCDWLCTQSVKDITQACHPIFQHNFDLCMQNHQSRLENDIRRVANALC